MNIIQILSLGKLEITVADGLRDDELALLRRTVVGNPGGLRYSLRNVHEQIAAYGKNIFFFSVRRNGKLLGIIAFCKRRHFTLGQEGVSFYVRYLSIDTPYQGRLRGGSRQPARRSPVKEGTIKGKILDLLNHPELLKIFSEKNGGPALLYNALESYNQRSENLIRKAGYEHIRDVATVPFSRLRPRKHPGFDRAKKEEAREIESRLREYYKDYGLFTLDYAPGGGDYLVMRKDGEITASLHARPFTFHIEELPGTWGWILFNLVGKLPVLNRLFSPGMVHFVGLDALYCLPGKESSLLRLMESTCAEYRRNTALTWLDTGSTLLRDLKKAGRLGLLHRFFKGKPVKIYALFNKHSEEEINLLKNNPVYISAFDLS